MSSNITFRRASGEWGIEGVDLSALPPKVYAALYKLMDLEHPDFQAGGEERQDLVTALVAMEKLAHQEEERVAIHRNICRDHGIEIRDKLRWERQAEIFRIAAGCMWEKLERMEDRA